MRTLPEIVYELKQLITELEQHTGTYTPETEIDFDDGVSIDIVGGAQPTFTIECEPLEHELFSFGNTGPSNR